MKKKIAIIGAGPGGYTAALHASRLGADVTLVEMDKTGGVCLNRGCVPSKIMKNTADLLAKTRKAALFGISGVQNPQVDLSKLCARQGSVIAALAQGIDAQLQKARVRRISGKGKICGQGALKVMASGENEVEVAWDKLIIASGSKPLELANLPFDGCTIFSSNDLLKIQEVPESIVIVGGGVIACEFAFILNSFGSKVTVVEALDRVLPLPAIDAECSKVLARQMKKNGIKFMANTIVESVTLENGAAHVILRPVEQSHENNLSAKTIIVAEKVAVCVGRQSVAYDLGLESLQLSLDERGWLPVNGCLQTAHSDVYAIGDILGPSKSMLAHAAIREAQHAASNCMGTRQCMDYRFMPSVIFSSPEVGCVGLSEQVARGAGIEVGSATVNFRTSSMAHVIDEIDGMVKIVFDKKNSQIVGVHIIGPHASDLLGEAVVLVHKGCSVDELAAIVHAHPTLAETMWATATYR